MNLSVFKKLGAVTAIGVASGAMIGLATAVGCSSSAPRGESAALSQPSENDSAHDEDTDSSDEGPAVRSSMQSHSGLFQWPVDSARLSRGFRASGRKPHWGIDLAAPKGTPILAAHDGIVIYTGREFRGFGKMVMIEGGKGWATLYAHFSKITAREGQRVLAGDKIGEMGRTGHATGNHLHFEVRKENGPVDPLDYLPNGATVARLVDKRRQQSN
jgi:murein DD-endopeptidase MepM/ murein hydrolase activator NlpD